MKARAFGALAIGVGLAFSGVSFAQQPPTTQPPPQQPPGMQAPRAPESLRAMDGKTVTLAGCLVRESEIAGREAGIAERAGIGQEYVLTDVQMRTAAPTGADEPDRPATGMPPTGMAMKGVHVKLLEGNAEQMQKNLNRQIEVTGRLEVHDTPAGRAERPETPAPGEPRPGMTGMRDDHQMPQIHVTSVRVLNQPCTPPKP